MYSIYFFIETPTAEHPNWGKYPNWDSMKAFMIIFLLSMFMNGASWARALVFDNLYFQKLLACSSIVFSIFALRERTLSM